MRSARLVLLALAVCGLASCQEARKDPRDYSFPVGTCVDYTSTSGTVSIDPRDCSTTHQWVIEKVIVHTTAVIADHEACPDGDRGVEWPEERYGALVCLRPSTTPSPVPAATASPEVATVSPEVATVSPEVAACSHGGPNPQPVVAAGTGESGALLLTDDPLLDLNPPATPQVWLYACRWERDDAGVHETDSRGGNVEASRPATVSIDRALTTGAEPTEHVLGGRVAPAVASVQVTLPDGSVENAVVSNGYWLAWWPGTAGSARVTGLDASGAILSDTPFTSGDL